MSRFDEQVFLSRYRSFAQQVLITKRLQASSVLQIGVFSGEVTSLLINEGVNVFTVDNDAYKKPDKVLDVRDLNVYTGKAYPLIICSRVLAQLQKKELQEILYSLYNLTTSHVLLSFPAKYFYADVTIGSLLLQRLTGSHFSSLSLRVPFLLPHKPLDSYEWVVGTRGSSRKWLAELFVQAGFVVEDDFFVQADVYEYFVLLKKP